MIAEGRVRATLMVSEMERMATEFLMEGRCTLNHAIDSYLRTYVRPGIDSGVDQVQQTAMAASARLNHCRSIPISYINPGFAEPSGPLAGSREMAKGFARKPIGDFYIDELFEQQATDYIRVRLEAGRAKSTVKREVYVLQSVVNKLRYTDQKAWRRLNSHTTPSRWRTRLW